MNIEVSDCFQTVMTIVLQGVEMKIGIMQPYFFPYIGYWQLLNAVDTFVIADDYDYRKHSWIKRNHVLYDGKRIPITLEIKKASSNKKIYETECVNDKKNISKMLRKIEYAYKKSPNFDEVYPMVEEIINYKERNLALFLENLIRKISSYLSIDTSIICSSSLDKKIEVDKQDKVIEICNLLGGREYLNAIGGTTLYSKEYFAARGIKLGFVHTKDIEYKQFTKPPVKNLSIIDVLMFNSREETKILLGEYDIV